MINKIRRCYKLRVVDEIRNANIHPDVKLNKYKIILKECKMYVKALVKTAI